MTHGTISNGTVTIPVTVNVEDNYGFYGKIDGSVGNNTFRKDDGWSFTPDLKAFQPGDAILFESNKDTVYIRQAGGGWRFYTTTNTSVKSAMASVTEAELPDLVKRGLVRIIFQR